MDEHQVHVGVALWDGGEFGDHERVAGNVDCVAWSEGGVAEGGRGGGAGGDGVAEFEHPAVGGGDLGRLIFLVILIFCIGFEREQMKSRYVWLFLIYLYNDGGEK